jgi:hypothetical protein
MRAAILLTLLLPTPALADRVRILATDRQAVEARVGPEGLQGRQGRIPCPPLSLPSFGCLPL